jgi:hypothetical protein
VNSKQRKTGKEFRVIYQDKNGLLDNFYLDVPSKPKLHVEKMGKEVVIYLSDNFKNSFKLISDSENNCFLSYIKAIQKHTISTGGHGRHIDNSEKEYFKKYNIGL